MFLKLNDDTPMPNAAINAADGGTVRSVALVKLPSY